MTRKICILGGKICMTKEDIQKTLLHSCKKSVFYSILRKKISILPNSKGKKSVYTDKISMSGRSEYNTNNFSDPSCLFGKCKTICCTTFLHHWSDCLNMHWSTPLKCNSDKDPERFSSSLLDFKQFICGNWRGNTYKASPKYFS